MTVTVVLTGDSVLYERDVGEMSCVWDAETPHAVCMAPLLEAETTLAGSIRWPLVVVSSTFNNIFNK